MKTRITFIVIAAVALQTIFSCSREPVPEAVSQVETSGSRIYTMAVVAAKGNATTRALQLEGNTLNASWNQGEKVSVYNAGGEKLGELEAQGSGTTTTLKGSLEGDLAKNDVLTLKFLSPNYSDQLGTIDYIAANCDYATAEVTVTEVEDNNITVSDATFINQQAIVKFSLKDKSSDETIEVSGLSVKAGGKTITITPASAASELFVAIPAVSGADIDMEATLADRSKRYYHKEDATFAQGKYYAISVKMSQDRIQYIERNWNGTEVIDEEKFVTDYTPMYGSSAGVANLSAGGWYVVTGNYSGDVVSVNSGDPVHLILCDGVTLSANRITINSGSTLIIYPQTSGSGAIEARINETSGQNHAAIGSDGTSSMGTLVIHGGKITATTESDNAAGIGSGYVAGNHVNGGTLTVYGGLVTATGGKYAAGIGGCLLGSGGTVNVYGGSIIAKGGERGAGIGSGRRSDSSANITSGEVNIYNCYTIEARGGQYGAGIGGGQDVSGAAVTINGGSVSAYGGEDAAGIGSGEQVSNTITGGTVTITGGYVYATGSDDNNGYGAGIGGGQDAHGAIVYISGGEVHALGGKNAAGIGSGEETTGGPNINGGSLTVTGGKVTAIGSWWGAGIGAGNGADGATVRILGGTVEAWAGAKVGPDRGCAIGSEGGDGHLGLLEIEGDLKVTGWENDVDSNVYTAGERVGVCFYRRRVKIEPCVSHNFSGGVCTWCGHAQ